MKNKLAILFCASLLSFPLYLKLKAEPTTPAKGKPAEKPKDDKKKEKEKDKEKEEPKTILSDFLSNTPYSREKTKVLPSPFRNLIVVEKNRLKAEKIKAEKEAADEAIRLQNADPNDKTAPRKLPEGQPEKEFVLLQEARKNMELVLQLVEIRKYELAESKLDAMDNILLKNNVEKYRDEIKKKKEEVIAEHKDWDEINKIMTSLTVDAMFIAEGKKKVALINDIAVEEGDDLNEMLTLAKDSPIILTFVSNNSLKIKFKKFTLQKELIDNDL